MLGGGTFTAQNKILPGAYINYVSAQRAGVSLSERGICALPIELNWGADGEVFRVSADELERYSETIFGYSLDADEMKPIREIFKHATKCYFYRLNSGSKASCELSAAKYTGTRGNDIKHVITANVDDSSKLDVMTYVGSKLVDTQTVAKAEDLVSNDFVDFKVPENFGATAGILLANGTNGTVSGTQHQSALSALEPYTFNALGCMSADDSIMAVYGAYCKRMRDKVGAKFVLVTKGLAHDYVGTINVKNTVSDAGAAEYALVPWVMGAEAGCEVNKSCENMTYDGEYTIKADYNQIQLEDAIKAGEFTFHTVGDDVKVLSDINSYVTVTEEMNEDFQLNQVLRVLDQIAIDTASVFNKKYLGKVQNDVDGRISFWSDVVDIHTELQKIRAIEEFESEDIVVEKGNDKRSVVLNASVKPVCAFAKLYMSISVE